MKGISRRARACAVVALTGATVLATAGIANAQRPASAGDGVPTGQGSVQMFNFGGFINNGGGVTGGSTGGTKTAAELGINIANAAAGTQLRHGDAAGLPQQPPRRAVRLPVRRGPRQRRDVRLVRLPGQQRHRRPHHAPRAARQEQPALRRLARRHDRVRLARARQRRPRSSAATRSARAASRTRASAPTTTRCAPSRPSRASASTRSRPASAPSTGTTTAASSRTASSTTASARRRGRSSWSASTRATASPRSTPAGPLTPTTTSPARRSRALINQFPNSVKMLHIKDLAANIAPATPPASGDPLDGTGVRLPGRLRHRRDRLPPDLRGGRQPRPCYHREQDGGSLNDAAISLANLKGIGSNVKGTVSAFRRRSRPSPPAPPRPTTPSRSPSRTPVTPR